MTETVYKFSMYFDGAQVFFTFAHDAKEAEVLANIVSAKSSIDVALAQGFTSNIAGLEADEKKITIDGWVLGKNSKGQPCVFLYRPAPLKYKAATVWEESIKLLPFDVDLSKELWKGGAPERSTAEKERELMPVKPFDVILKQRGTTDDGKPTFRFDRLFSPVPIVASTTTSGTERAREQEAFKAIQGQLDVLAKACENWGYKVPASTVGEQEDYLSEMCGKDIRTGFNWPPAEETKAWRALAIKAKAWIMEKQDKAGVPYRENASAAGKGVYQEVVTEKTRTISPEEAVLFDHTS